MKLSKLVKKQWLKENFDKNEEHKQKFLESISNFSKYSESVYRNHNLVKMAEDIAKIIDKAEYYTLQETEEWFDDITVKRNMNELKNHGKQFLKVAHEVQKLQTRMEALYDDIGTILNRYYSIEEGCSLKKKKKKTVESLKKKEFVK